MTYKPPCVYIESVTVSCERLSYSSLWHRYNGIISHRWLHKSPVWHSSIPMSYGGDTSPIWDVLCILCLLHDVTKAWIRITTLVSQIVEHTEIDEHLGRIAENIIVEHLFYTIFIATNNRTPGIFFHCVNSQTCLTIRDTRVSKSVIKIVYLCHTVGLSY